MVTFLLSVLDPEKPTTSPPGLLPTLETDEDLCPPENTGFTILEQLGITFLCFVVVLGLTLILGLVRMLRGKSGKI